MEAKLINTTQDSPVFGSTAGPETMNPQSKQIEELKKFLAELLAKDAYISITPLKLKLSDEFMNEYVVPVLQQIREAIDAIKVPEQKQKALYGFKQLLKECISQTPKEHERVLETLKGAS